MNGRWVPLLAVCLAGCVIERPGPTQHDFQTVERDSSELVRVNLIMGAGNLRVDSGTDKLAAADFTYNLASWKPEIRYTSAAGRGSLTIRQSESHQPHLGKNEYEWDLRLNREVPLDLTVHFGAGEARLNVGRDFSIKLLRYGARYFALQGQHVPQIAIVTPRPQMAFWNGTN